MPRLTTPERMAFEKFRQRQQERAGSRFGEIEDLDTTSDGKTPLGLDPVEGDPVDLRELWGNLDGGEPSEEQRAAANFEVENILGDDSDDIGDAVDRLLGN